jgi:hypothetical protein
MKKMEKQLDPEMEVFICIGCGNKKQFPKKSSDKIAADEKAPKLDKERAASEGILHIPESDEKTVSFDRKDAQKLAKIQLKEIQVRADLIKESAKAAMEKDVSVKESSPKSKNLAREIKNLNAEVVDLKVKLERAQSEKDDLKKSLKAITSDLNKTIESLRSATQMQIKNLETILVEIERKIK